MGSHQYSKAFAESIEIANFEAVVIDARSWYLSQVAVSGFSCASFRRRFQSSFHLGELAESQASMA
jgi:hypothetical protein